MLHQEALYVFTTLTNAIAVVAKPRAGFLYDISGNCGIQKIPFLRNTFSIHDVKLHHLKGRGHLVLYNLYLGTVAYALLPYLNGIHLAHIKTHGGIEL